jgi:hypothetical protein
MTPALCLVGGEPLRANPVVLVCCDPMEEENGPKLLLQVVVGGVVPD